MTADVMNSMATFDPLPSFGGVFPHAEIVETTDQYSFEACWARLVAEKWAEVLIPSTVSKPQATDIIDSQWFARSLSQLSSLKDANVDADVDQDRSGLIETTEYLIAHFAAWPEARRPDISFDPFGQPHFSAKQDGYYLHLSIGDDSTLNWYAVLNGIEHSQDEAHLVGAALPPSLLAIAYL